MMPSPPPTSSGEHGYALVAAVLALAVVAVIALELVSATRIAVVGGSAEVAHAKAEAAADAGVALALHDLVGGHEAAVALFDGRPRELAFADCRITIRVEEERGKVPINTLEDDKIERLLAQAGLQGAALETARDSLLDWQDDDDEPREHGAESAEYAPAGIAPRNAALKSVDELVRVRGFTPALVDRLRTYVTAEPDALPFDPARASVQAIAVMDEGGAESVSAVIRGREATGQRTALAFGNGSGLAGRPLTIVVDADAPGRGHVHREVLAVIQRSDAHPYAIRSIR